MSPPQDHQRSHASSPSSAKRGSYHRLLVPVGRSPRSELVSGAPPVRARRRTAARSSGGPSCERATTGFSTLFIRLVDFSTHEAAVKSTRAGSAVSGALG